MAGSFLNSAGFRIGTAPRLTAFLLYATILGRDPDAAEMADRRNASAQEPLRGRLQRICSVALLWWLRSTE